MTKASHLKLGDVSSPKGLSATLKAEREIFKAFFHGYYLVDIQHQHERAIRECFTADAEDVHDIFHGAPTILRGHDELIAYQKKVANPALQSHAHVVGQHHIEWTDGRPMLRAYVTAWHWFSANSHLGEARPSDWSVVALVENEYRHENGRWLICRRMIKAVGGVSATGSLPSATDKVLTDVSRAIRKDDGPKRHSE